MKTDIVHLICRKAASALPSVIQSSGLEGRVGGASASPANPFSLTDSNGNSSLRPLLWMVLLLPAVALVLGFGVFVGLSQTWVQKLWENSEWAQ